MTTPDEFLKRVHDAVDELSLRLSNTTPDRQQAFLQQFEANVRAQWREALPFLSGDDIDGMVGDAVTRITARRDRLESFGSGTA
jgi:hypothetical protein